MTIDYRPFVFYGGNCRDAFTRYKEILGGDLALLTLADAPSESRYRRSRRISSSTPP